MRRSIIPIAVLIIMAVCLTLPASAEDRSLFSNKLSLEYFINLNRGGKIEKTTENQEFFREDKMQFVIEPGQDSYAYILMRGSSGKYQMLFPSRSIEGGTNRLEDGVPFSVPGNGYFTIDYKPGIEQVFFILSTEKIPTLESFINQAAIPPDQVINTLLNLRNRQAENLTWTLEKEEDKGVISLKSKVEDPVLMYDFFIRHK